MTRTVHSLDELDAQYYETLLGTIVESFPWTPASYSASTEQSIERATSDHTSVGELVLSHLYTGARMYVVFPDYRSTAAARLVLEQPLDPDLPSSSEHFVGDLQTAQTQIAQKYETDYTTLLDDSGTILRASIPPNYSNTILYSTLTAISTIALGIQRLHERIRAPLSGESTPSVSGNYHRGMSV